MFEGIQKKQEQPFRSLLERLQVGVVVHDAETRILYSNPFAAKLLGLSVEGMSGKLVSDPHWRFFREDRTPLPLSEFPVSRVLREQKSIQNQVLGIQIPDHEKVVWVLCNSDPEFDLNGQLSQIIVNFTEITEVKTLREELSEIKGLFESALDQSQAGIIIADASSGHLKYMNQTAFMMKSGNLGEKVSDVDVKSLLSFWRLEDLEGNVLALEETPIYRAIERGVKTSGEY